MKMLSQLAQGLQSRKCVNVNSCDLEASNSSQKIVFFYIFPHKCIEILRCFKPCVKVPCFLLLEKKIFKGFLPQQPPWSSDQYHLNKILFL